MIKVDQNLKTTLDCYLCQKECAFNCNKNIKLLDHNTNFTHVGLTNIHRKVTNTHQESDYMLINQIKPCDPIPNSEFSPREQVPYRY